MPLSDQLIDVPPYRYSGNVFCALLNHAPLIASLGAAVNEPPYKKPPEGPVLAVRPRNTLIGNQDRVTVPAQYAELMVGATLGIVIGRSASRVSADQAFDYISGFTVANDISAPLTSHYRPAVRLKACDGFCPISQHVVPANTIKDPDQLRVTVSVDGIEKHQTSTADRIRSVAALVADISDFMTLQAGDVLLLGAAADQPTVSAGQTVSITIDQVGELSNLFVAEETQS
ncbi:MAG: fumarylacetoacetate hydrolase family protein [Burkholderiaceae bacterium]